MTRNQQESNAKKARRVARVRARVTGTKERPRLAVFRSLAHIRAQVIDDTVSKTLAAAADTDLAEKDRTGKKKAELAFLVGKMLAERAKAKGVSMVVLDRRDKQYLGRVKALADGAREGGLQF